MANNFPSEDRPGETNPPSRIGPIIGGAVLVLIGLIFLLQNLNIIEGGFPFDNWWALFILIPAVGSFYRVWQDYQRNGRFTGESRGALIGGLVLLFVASVFLFELDWGRIWPVFLIIAGLGALLGGWFRHE